MQLQNITLAYSTKTILRNISLQIGRGEFVFLIGTSGSGKTSFIRSIIGELPPRSGTITDEQGRDIYRLSRSELLAYRRRLGIIFQDFKLLPHRTVEQNVAFAMEVCGYSDAEITRRVPEVLAQVGLLSNRKKRIEVLSGGEIQRVSIARALIHDPQVIIGDEPTGNLDPKNAKEVIDLLLDLSKLGKTVIIATHDDRLVDRLEKRVIAFEDGRIVSDVAGGKYCL